MANQESKQPVYKEHLTAWRPDYPPLWNVFLKNKTVDISFEPFCKFNIDKNIKSFSTAHDAIAKCIGQC